MEDGTVDAHRSTSRGALRAIRQTGNLLESSAGYRVTRDSVARHFIGVGRPSGHFVAQAQIHRKVRTRAPVILNIPSEKLLPEPDFVRAARSQRVELIRRIRQEIVQSVIGAHPAVGAQLLEHVVLHVLEIKPDFECVRSARQEGVVGNLGRIPGVIETVEAAQPEGSRQSRNRDLRRCRCTGCDGQCRILGNRITRHRVVDFAQGPVQT